MIHLIETEDQQPIKVERSYKCGTQTYKYSNIIVYQKCIGTSIEVGYATRSLYASLGQNSGVPNNNRRGRGSGPCGL